MDPLVSIVLPVHNDARRLARSVESIFAQTFTSWELFIVDDGSTDDTHAVAVSLGQVDGRIHVLRQEKAGEAHARNRGMRHVTGAWIAVQDSDDYWRPHKLQRQLEFLEVHPSVGVLGSYGYRTSAAGEKLGVYDLGPTTVSQFHKLRRGYEPFGLIHSSVLMRRDLVERAGGYPVDYALSSDLAFFNLRLAPLTNIVVLPERLVFVEIRSDSISRRLVDHAFDDLEVIRLNLRRQRQGLPVLNYRESLDAMASRSILRRIIRLQQRLRQRWYTRGAARIAARSPRGLGLLLMAFLVAPPYTVRRLWSQVVAMLLERFRGGEPSDTDSA